MKQKFSQGDRIRITGPDLIGKEGTIESVVYSQDRYQYSIQFPESRVSWFGDDQLELINIQCWNCMFCDKESVLKNGKWVLTRTGYCLAEKSSVNGPDSFYEKVYINTVQKSCAQYEPENK